MACHRRILLRVRWPRTTFAAALACHLICIWLLAGSVYGLDPNKRLTQYMHTSWRIQDGSAPSGIEAIAQTSDGYLWFSSDSQGMYRFDGVRFLPWTLASNGKTINKIVNVYGDHAGGLWALGEREIAHLKGGVVTSHFNLDGLQHFHQVSEDPDGSLWVVRGQTAVSDAPLCRITDRAVKCFGKSDGVPISPADSLLADGKGGFWLGGQTALVHWHDGVSEMYRIEALKSNAGQNGIASLAHGPDGSLWVGIQAEGPGLGLGQLKEGAVKPFVTPTFDGSKVVVSEMISDRDGNLWVATAGKGIFLIHGNVVDHYQQTDGLSSDSVLDVLEDREGIVWAVTTNGIDNFRDPSVSTFSAREGLRTDAAAGVLASRDGTIWVANAGSLDQIKDGKVSSIRTGSGLPGHQVTAMLEDHAGNLWVGVDDELYLFKSGRFRRLPEPNHQPLGMVVGMTEDNDGDIWAECLSNPRKLVRIRDFQVREEFPASQIPPGHSLASDPHGGIWIATKKGDIGLLRNGVFETKFPLNPGGDPSNRQIMSTADGSILAGSENGLVEWRQDTVHRMTTKNGLPCNSVISFIEDKESRWWLHTGCGVVQFPDSELERWRANPEAVVQTRVYDVLDGARPTGGPSFNAAAYSSDGRVWFATGFVVEMVDPSRLSQKALPAQAYIESLIADRKEFKATPNLKVAPNLRDLQIDYTSPTFSIPQKVKFRYRLDGYDRDWQEAGTRRQAFYTDLPPGEYSFRVMACNSEGVWNESAAKLDFYVAPAYYQTNWFRALCAALFLALLWAAYQWRVWQLQRDFKKLGDVIETIPAIVLEVGPDGSGASANRRWLEYTGSPLRQYGRFAPEDQAWRDSTCIHPDELDGYVKLWERAIATGQPFELETRLRRADGEYRWFLARHVPLRDERGKVLKWYGTFTDIDDRKRAEEEVRNTAAQWQATFDAVQDLVLLLDKDFRVLRANQAAAEFLGLPFDKIVGGHCYDLTHATSMPPAECPLAKMRQSRRHEEAEVLAGKGGPWLSVSVDPLFDPSGELTQVVHVARDITERKRAEEALREGETRFRTFVDHAGDALFVYDLEQRTVVDVNRSACESLGYTRQELIGKSPLGFHLDSYQAEMESVTGRAAAGETVVDRHWHRRKDGSTFPVEVHTSLVSYGGRRFLLMVARDISDRVRAEEQRDRLRQLEADLAHIDRISILGELAASIAHEVNQPLSGIVSSGSACLRWLGRDVPDLEEAREAARRIVRDGKRAGEIIARIRALTKKAVASGEKLDLNETIREVLGLVGDEAKRKSVNIRTQFADDLFPVSGDPVQLQQVVLNLAMNAIEAMSSVGERARELLMTTRNIDPDQVQVTVEDSGIGIDPQVIDKIFDSFYTTKAGGMGMGLSVSRSILRAHGGRLWATAKDGAGTIFYFTLPRYHEEESNAGVAAV